MILHFRIATDFELPIAIALFKEAAENLNSRGIDHWRFWLEPTPAIIDWVAEGFKNKEFYFVETEGEVVVGMFRLMFEDQLYWGKQDMPSGYIHNFVVRQAYSGKQVGTQILEYIEQLLLTKGIQFLRLDCNAKNVRLCNYYIQQGFVKVAEKQTQLTRNSFFEKALKTLHTK